MSAGEARGLTAGILALGATSEWYYLELSTPLAYGRRLRTRRTPGLSPPQPLVKGGDDLLLHALEGLDVSGRDGAEHDLVDTGVDELADSIDDVI